MSEKSTIFRFRQTSDHVNLGSMLQESLGCPGRGWVKPEERGPGWRLLD